VEPPEAAVDVSRAERLADRRGWRRRVGLASVAICVATSAFGVYAVVANGDARSFDEVAVGGSATSSTARTVTTTTIAPTTTTTIPPLVQPPDVALPGLGFGPLRQGHQNDAVLAYEQRLRDLRFDPGPVDGLFDQKTRYAVEAVAKQVGLPRDGVITAEVQAALQHWVWTPAMPTAEGDRVEIDLDRQVLIVYKAWQPVLITTTSTGSGEHFCGGDDGCQYAITPAGRFQFTWHANGWQKSELGQLYEPYYFNGGIAVHGYPSVPVEPASHGCARIPMHIAEYFDTLVYRDMVVYVVGTPKPPGGAYVGPYTPRRPAPPPTAPPAPPPAPPVTAPPTAPPTTPPPTTAPPTTAPVTTSPPTTASPPTT
jgi:peptidoglycan hydrolase-like protein with peptidoglycan-binding domain